MSSISYVKLTDLAQIRNDLRKPINSSEREKRISGKPQSKLFPYYGATGQVGYIDSFLSDGEFVLVGEDGAPFLDFTKNKAYLISGKAWVNNHAHVLKAKELKSTNRFLFHYLNYFNYKDYVSGTTRLKLTKGKLEQIPVPDISYDDQKTIVYKIDSLFAEIESGVKEIESAKQKLELYRQSILNAAIRGKLVPQDSKDEPASVLLEKIQIEKEKLIAAKKIRKEKPLPPITKDEIPFELPNKWAWVRLGDIVTALGDGLHGTPNYDDSGDYFFINGNNLINGKIEIKDNTKRISKSEYEKHKKNLTQNTILTSINGTIGNVAFYNNEKVILGKSACYFNVFEDVDKRYIQTVLNSPYYLNYAHTTATGSTIKNVSLKSMREFLLPLPPSFIQIKISEQIESFQLTISKIETSIEDNLNKSRQLKQSILKKAFEGRL